MQVILESSGAGALGTMTVVRSKKARVMVYIWNDPSEVPADFGPSVVTFGNFDGVHRGHQQVLSQLTRTARQGRQRSCRHL